MEMVIALGIFFIVVTAVFVSIAFFFPEWLGITGSKAKEIIQSHTADEDSAATAESENGDKPDEKV
jgi:hypothetical protein